MATNKTNEFRLQGRVGYVDIKYTENKTNPDKATVYTTINLGVRKTTGLSSDEDKNWDNFFITFFNTSTNNIAERLADSVKKGDYIRVVGKLSENKYEITTENGEKKEKSEIQLIGYGFKKQRYDEMEQEWVDIN